MHNIETNFENTQFTDYHISLCTYILYLWSLRTIENSFGYRIERYKNYFRNRSSTDEYSEHINLQEDLVLFKLRHLGSRIFLVWLAKLFETGIHFWLVNVWPEHQKFSWIRAARKYGDFGNLPFIFRRLDNPFRGDEVDFIHQHRIVPTNFLEIPGPLEWITRAASAQVLNRQSVDGGHHTDPTPNTLFWKSNEITQTPWITWIYFTLFSLTGLFKMSPYIYVLNMNSSLTHT